MEKILTFLKKYASLPAGIFLMAFSLHSFFEPFDIVSGGATGLGIILEDVIGIPLWISNLAINVPLFVWAYFVFDKHFVLRAAASELLFTFFLYLFEGLYLVESDFVTSAIFGGALYGVGVGMVLRTGTTTGGTDLAASIVNSIFSHIKIPVAMLILDVAVILTGFTVFGTVRAMYGIIAVTVMSKTSDFMLTGLNFAKAAFIVSEKGEELGKALTGSLDRGATLIKANGVYSGSDKQVLIVAAPRKQIPALREITGKIDPNCFMFVTDIREILGKFRE